MSDISLSATLGSGLFEGGHASPLIQMNLPQEQTYLIEM